MTKTHVHRIVYGGVCEIWVEAQDNTITKVLGAVADEAMIGKRVSEFPEPSYYEQKLMASYGDERVGRPAPHTYDGQACDACGRVHATGPGFR